MNEHFPLQHQQAAALPLRSDTREAVSHAGSFFSQLPPLPSSSLAPPPPPPSSSLPPPPKMFPDTVSFQHDGVKKPINAFVLWSIPKRRELARRYPAKHSAVISHVLFNEWQKMSLEKKQPFIEAARRIRERHRRVKQLHRPESRELPRLTASPNYMPTPPEFSPGVCLHDSLVNDIMAVPNNHILTENGVISSPIGIDQVLRRPQELQALQVAGLQYAPSVNVLPGVRLQNQIGLNGATITNPSGIGISLFSPPPHPGGPHQHMVGSQHLAVNNFVIPSVPAAPRPLPFAPSLPSPIAAVPIIPPQGGTPLPPPLSQQLIGNRGPLHYRGIPPAMHMQQRQHPNQVFGGGQPGSLPRIVLPSESLDNPNSPLQPLLKHAVFPPQDVVPRPSSLLIDGSSLRLSRDMQVYMTKSETNEAPAPTESAGEGMGPIPPNWEAEFIDITEQPNSPVHRPSSSSGTTPNSVPGSIPMPSSLGQNLVPTTSSKVLQTKMVKNSIPTPSSPVLQAKIMQNPITTPSSPVQKANIVQNSIPNSSSSVLHSKIQTSVSHNSSPRPQTSAPRSIQHSSSKPQVCIPNLSNSAHCSSSQPVSKGSSSMQLSSTRPLQKSSHQSSKKPKTSFIQGSVPISPQKSIPKVSTSEHGPIASSEPCSSHKACDAEQRCVPKTIRSNSDLEAPVTAKSSSLKHPHRQRFISRSSSQHRSIPIKIGSVRVSLARQDFAKKLALKPSHKLVTKSQKDVPPLLLDGNNCMRKTESERRRERKLVLPSKVRTDESTNHLNRSLSRLSKKESENTAQRFVIATKENGVSSPLTPPPIQQPSPIVIPDSPRPHSTSEAEKQKLILQPPPLFRDRLTRKALPTPSRRLARIIPKPPPLYSDNSKR